MKPLSEQLAYTKEALAQYDEEQPDRDAIIDKAQTEEDVNAYYYAMASAVEEVQDAFYRDCKINDIPNSLSHCRVVDISTLKRWCAGEKTG